ncbi:MAG: hypothetical protein IKR38_08290 [Bacteroidales bacterium]|nr:hypothetical protein [Bacteroidales bacterium]
MMKKLYFVILAAAAIVSAASCEKINDLVSGKTTTEQGLVDDKGKDLTPDQQKVKIEETANTLMELMDKSQWEADYENVMSTVAALDQKENLDASDIEAYLKGIVDAWSSVKGEDPYTVTVTVAHLTQIKGHFTENKEGKFDFQDADDLSITVFDGEIPVTVTFAAKDEAATPAHFSDQDDDVTIYIPASSTLSIAKNNEVIGSLEIRLSPKDLNGDNIITEADAISVSYTMKAGAYTFDLSQADYATDKASVSAKILMGKQLIIGASVSADYTFEKTDEGIDVLSASAKAMVNLAGKTQIRFTIPDGVKLQEALAKVSDAQLKGDGDAFKAAIAELEKLYGFGVYYDGKNTLQATIGFEAVYNEELKFWDANPVIRFADGTSYAVEDYFSQERFGDLAGEIMKWIQELMDYLGIKVENSDESAQ